MRSDDIRRFGTPVPITSASGKSIGSYQIIHGTGHPEDPLYTMNVSDAAGKIVGTVEVMRSYSLLSRMGADGKPDKARLPSIPLPYLTEAAPVLIETRHREFPDIATALADALDAIDNRCAATPLHLIN